MSARDLDRMGHSYPSKELMNFRLYYSYRKYLQPILLQANDMAGVYARYVAAEIVLVAVLISIISLLTYRFVIAALVRSNLNNRHSQASIELDTLN